jgi:MFS family permease
MTLLLVNLLVGCAEGPLTVLAPGTAAARGTPGVAGLLLSAMPIGSLAGALVYGALVDVATVYRRLLACTCLTAVAFVLLGLVGGHIGAFAAVAAVAGLGISPTITSAFIAIRSVTARQVRTEAFAWASFCATAGASGGQVAAGVLMGGPGLGLALWEPFAFAVIAVAVALLLVRSESA